MSRLSSELLKQAGTLANLEQRRPKDASIRRAISTAYYALFHFLLEEATGILVGASQNDRQIRHLLSRCFVHGKMANACERIVGLVKQQQTPPSSAYGPFARLILNQANDLQVVAKNFKDLQERRHRADYDLRHRYTKTQALRCIADVEEAMRALKRIRNAEPRVTQLVAVMLLHIDQIR
jgi:uncharacterized protein (UPF0332 family)